MTSPSQPAIDTRPASLTVTGLTKRYGDVTAVDDLDLELGPGELLAVVGPSGCGKSTLLRAVAGLVVPDGGRIALGDTVVEDGSNRIPPERRGIGLVFQDHALFPHLTVRDNVAFGIRDGSAAETASRVGEMLELVSLPTYADRYPHELSGGERQRVALARALAPGPSLMLFDEPFASIDHNLRVRLRADVVEALRATRTPALFVTHDQGEALAIGDRIAVLRRGRIAQIDPPARVFHQPADAFVGAFMGEASFLSIDDRRHTRLGPLDDHDPGGRDHGERVMAMVRPDDLRFAVDAAGDARVVAGEYRGSAWLLSVELDDGPVVLVAASHLDAPEPGTLGRVSLAPGHQQVPVGTGPGDLPDRAPDGHDHHNEHEEHQR
ncbi:MAG: ABC transporter ATP-binding protein [Actinomycetota bacterium]